jgi:hypothetical protein
MCTVTILPLGANDFVLTTNRDESPERATLAPDFYKVDETTLLYPKDKLSGGTWVGVSERNRLVCVLNGGFGYHRRKASYRISRGIVANDLLVSMELSITVDEYNLTDIEPFTMVIVDWNNGLKFMELVWDGDQKHFRELSSAAHIWSSSTLYSEDMKTERHQWFKDFESAHKLSPESLLEFHLTAGKDNKDYGVIMDRGFVKTTSITQVKKMGEHVSMWFNNLQDNDISTQKLKLPITIDE